MVWLVTVPSQLRVYGFKKQKVSSTLYILSKSVLDPLHSVKKCLLDSLCVLFEVSLPPDYLGTAPPRPSDAQDEAWAFPALSVGLGERDSAPRYDYCVNSK